jgi:putative tricarboxylic transport membrane protein
MRRIRGPKSLSAGLLFIGLALIFGVSASSLTLGTAAQMGPGYFPLLVAVVLGVLGVAVVAEGIFHSDDRPEGASLRGIAFVGGAVLAFAASVESLGLVAAVAITSFLMSLAERNVRLGSAVGAAVVLSSFSWLVFVYALSMPWPAFGYLLH